MPHPDAQTTHIDVKLIVKPEAEKGTIVCRLHLEFEVADAMDGTQAGALLARILGPISTLEQRQQLIDRFKEELARL